MNINEKVYMKDREHWRKWLLKYHRVKKDVWLVYYKKHTGLSSISYTDAVEEAICFGWIDGQIKSINNRQYTQRYSPRTSKSAWSTINIGRARKMIKQCKMTPWGLQVYQEGIKSKRRVPSSNDFSVPVYLKAALSRNKRAWRNFQKFAPSARLAYVYWITTAKTAETRQKRIELTIENIVRNRKFGTE